MIKHEPLPYSDSGLSPFISSKTLSYHYGKHHKAYVEKTNQLVVGTLYEGLPLEDVILGSVKDIDAKALFNNAAQAWNHSFYWKSMKPGGGGKPGTDLLSLIKKSFGDFEDFREQFLLKATSHFGSGWVWLVKDGAQLKVVDTHDADNPLIHNQKPLMTLDVWEHAYYLDYQNQRVSYVKAFLDHCVDWGFAEDQL